MSLREEQFEQAASRILDAAKRTGADAADCIIGSSTVLSVSALNGATENVERDESTVLGLRVFSGNSQAIVSSSGIAESGFGDLAERAVAMARTAPPDEFAGLAETADLATEWPDLDLDDQRDPSAAQIADLATTCEAAGLNVAGVAKSNGGSASAGRQRIFLATSQGFSGGYSRSSYSIGASLVAGDGTRMERDYDSRADVLFDRLPDPGEVGQKAGERAVRRLNPRKIASQSANVIFDRRIASGLLMHLATATSGLSVARGSSFLKDRMKEQIFGPGIDIMDDATLPAHLGSRPFDAEGIAAQPRAIIENGRLHSWYLDCRSAKQLGLATTGHATRSPSSPPQPGASNLFLKPGTIDPAKLISDVGTGLLVTELIGMGVNPVTGDYSRGASGFWFENGEIVYPVSEITIAGNLIDMFARLTPANDLEMRQRINAPTCLLGEMTIAGA